MERGMYRLPDESVDYLDRLILGEDGLPQVLPYDRYAAIPIAHLQIWMNRYGLYTLPTTELIEWLREQIAGRSAIEICAGHGVIGRALGIPITDSYNQQNPEIQVYYRLHGQNPIQPPPDVLRFEAMEAVRHFEPEVVIGSFVTQKYQIGDEGGGWNHRPKIGSSVYGVDERSLLRKVSAYIHIGNGKTHGDKRLIAYSHTCYAFPWLITRAEEQAQNRIWIWEHTR